MNIQHLPSNPVTAALAKRFGTCAIVVAGLVLSAGHAGATIITFSGPIAVPSTFDGLYINLATGATGSSGASTPGWDFNPYNSGTALSFFWSGTPAGTSGGVAGTTTGPYLDLTVGSVISAASTFAAVTAAAATSAFQAPGEHILGFRFFNEGVGIVNYGYAVMNSGGSNGFPLTIQSWSFDNSGAAITVVPEPGTYAMMLAGLAAVGGLAMRRRDEQNAD